MDEAREALPRAVLVDMDGTIVDSEPIWLASEYEVMSLLGGPWEAADQALCLGGPLERVVNHMIDRSESSRSAVEVQDLLLASVEKRMRETPLVWRPGARELVVECGVLGLPLALVTASWRRLVDAMHEAICADLGFEPFAVIVAGDDVSESKPHPEPYLTAAAALSAQPEQCLALEDSPTGIRSACSAGCAVIAIPHMALVPPDLEPAIVNTLQGHDIAGLWALAHTDRSVAR